ncbi:hypothetical protein Ct61P_14519 [Colletotrichum tofieldiae]|nr:hypothetical protein Ct61P_14519 [Colletotrichum tofieldiae]
MSESRRSAAPAPASSRPRLPKSLRSEKKLADLKEHGITAAFFRSAIKSDKLRRYPLPELEQDDTFIMKEESKGEDDAFNVATLNRTRGIIKPTRRVLECHGAAFVELAHDGGVAVKQMPWWLDRGERERRNSKASRKGPR